MAGMGLIVFQAFGGLLDKIDQAGDHGFKNHFFIGRFFWFGLAAVKSRNTLRRFQYFGALQRYVQAFGDPLQEITVAYGYRKRESRRIGGINDQVCLGITDLDYQDGSGSLIFIDNGTDDRLGFGLKNQGL